MGNDTLGNPEFPMEGGCACGLRETGTAFALNAVIESSLITLLPSAPATVPGSAQCNAKPAAPPLGPFKEDRAVEPETILTPSESGKGQTIARCPKCRVAVWSNYGGAGPFCRFIRVGTLDEAWKVGPDVHIYTRSKRGFFRLDDGLPQFSGYYPSVDEVWSKQSLERWAKIWPEIVKYKESLVHRS
ncbi:hypothetical protein IFM61606_03063 [Aspergillus udagawae]|uniref:CENP-V/GFA domain-containing protein n=1 Tax=Aspergillus udagawae TaxID=91492 RepID=A0ABQ1AML2_9EURO|nr:hypothetical protein IFM51744_03291 [Aspergillus udagawae]GFF84699.1 hypothetical protein IFM53868_04232 [Aspergillus udagawae]GFG17980.1 hypothetical protein IFM5058_08767 [Aspergillus udagawae]GFG23188.1 hypothetical protein IFM61606_03063 [Aspergillus udagawae]